MAAVEDIVSVSITAGTATPTRTGFGVLLILAYHTHNSDRVRSYSSLSGMVSDGFSTTEPAYLAAAEAFSQNPRPSRVKIGRQSTAPSPTYTLTCTDATEGAVYSLTLEGTEITYTVGAAATTTTVATAIELLTEAVTGVSSTSSGAVITLTPATAGSRLHFEDWSSNLLFAETTADPSTAADLAAILLVDSDFYGVTLTGCGKAEITAAAAWCVANKRLGCFQTSDSVVMDSGSTTDIGYTEMGLDHDSALMFNHNDNQAMAGAAFFAANSTYDPGSETWMFKRMVGVSPDNLTDTQVANLKAKNVNHYVETGGVNMTQEGKCSSGSYIDVVRFLGWVEAEVKFRVYSLLVNSRKVPYTDLGIDQVKNQVSSVLADGVAVGGFVKGTTSVSAPTADEADSEDRAARILRDVTFSGRLAGAIHKVIVEGTVSV